MKRKRHSLTIGNQPLGAGHRQALERRLRALSGAVARYEREHGVITDAELLTQQRADERAAIVVNGRRST